MRASGVLLHLTSLPSPWGVGTMGQSARDFVEFLARAGQHYWQILPLGQTGFGNSPYQSVSSFAGNPYLIDLDDLAADDLLDKADYANENWGDDPSLVDFDRQNEKKWPVLARAVERLHTALPEDYTRFLEQNRSWLEDYALFMTIKEVCGGRPWQEWADELRHRNRDALERFKSAHANRFRFWQGVQYLFFRQWHALKRYANERNIRLIGDLPIYTACDSADVWARPDQFQLDENLMPREVAGVPPDAFAEDGQLWGNPLFDWEKMEQDGFAWWVERIRGQRDFFDVLRIDHFRGMEAYYAIPGNAENAREGVWKPGPGMKLFRAVEAALGSQDIIAEDLGFLTEGVYQLLRDSGFPGMKVLQFAFDDPGNNPYLPHNYPENCICYVGTHDNDTARGWLDSCPATTAAFAIDYFKLTRAEGLAWGLIRGALASPARLAIITAQDLLNLGSEARMNTPSTVGGKNWRWRALPGAFTGELADKLYHETQLYRRLG